MFKLVVIIFAMHGGNAEPLKAFRNPQDFATEATCNAFLNSKESKQTQRRVGKELAAIKGARLKAKWVCVKSEAEKPEDDGSI